MAWLHASDSGKESMGGRTRERYKSHRSQDPHQSRLEESSGLAPVARQPQEKLRVREYNPISLSEDASKIHYAQGSVWRMRLTLPKVGRVRCILTYC